VQLLINCAPGAGPHRPAPFRVHLPPNTGATSWVVSMAAGILRYFARGYSPKPQAPLVAPPPTPPCATPPPTPPCAVPPLSPFGAASEPPKP